MRTKPQKGQAIVYSVKRLWRDIFAVAWTDSLNYPNQIHQVCRKVDGQWTTGEAHPTGCKNGGLLRPVHPVLAQALNLQAV